MGQTSAIRKSLQREFIGTAAIALLLSASLTTNWRIAEASTAFGINYRQLTITTGSTNTGTSVSISADGTSNYIVDPYVAGSTLKGTPSSSTPDGHGWRSAGAFGHAVPAGTWSFTVETDTSLTSLLGHAFVSVYVYSTDALGGNIDPIGTATSTNDLFALLGSQSSSLSFSASAKDLTNRVLVVEYWITVTQAPVLATTVTFHTVSAVTSAVVPTSPSTTLYLGTPQLYSTGLYDSFATADSAGRFYAASSGASDGVGIGARINMRVTRSILDEVALSEQVAMKVPRSMTDNLVMSDMISTSVSRSLSDTLTVADSPAATMLASRSTSDMLPLGDGISTKLSRSTGDSLGLSDTMAARASVARSIADTIAMSDATNASAFYARAVFDAASFADSAAPVEAPGRSVTDALAVADRVSTGVARLLGDSVPVQDQATAATPIPRDTFDFLAVVDGIVASPGRLVPLGDTLAAGERITDVSIRWDRDFGEGIDLQDCTLFACNQALHLTESLSLTSALAPAPSIPDIVTIGDSIVTYRVQMGDMGESLRVAANVAFAVRPVPATPPPGSPAPPVSVMIVSDKNSINPLSAVPVSGTYSAGDDPRLLFDQLQIPAQDIGAIAPGLPRLTLVLPTYYVSLSPTPKLPSDSALLTAKLAAIPAETPVLVPIDLAATPAIGSPLPSIRMGYTPAVDSSNFALAISLLNAPPAGTQKPPADLAPLYIDVRWVGTFAGATSPAIGSYYKSPPVLIFAITDEWASQQNIQRDANGVPAISISLLDEGTGQWGAISAVDRPAGSANGQYVYTAHLQHFSKYAITAARAASSGSPTRTVAPDGEPAHLAVHIADSVFIKDLNYKEAVHKNQPQSLSVDLVENMGLSTRPDLYAPLKAGNDVNVTIKLAGIAPASALPPTAKVAITSDVVNVGYAQKELVLGFSDSLGHRSSTTVRIDAGTTKQVVTEMPFDSPGAFNIIAETKSVEGELLGSTSLTVMVSWLDVYLYLLILLQGILASIIALGMYILLKYRWIWT